MPALMVKAVKVKAHLVHLKTCVRAMSRASMCEVRCEFVVEKVMPINESLPTFVMVSSCFAGQRTTEGTEFVRNGTIILLFSQ